MLTKPRSDARPDRMDRMDRYFRTQRQNFFHAYSPVLFEIYGKYPVHPVRSKKTGSNILIRNYFLWTGKSRFCGSKSGPYPVQDIASGQTSKDPPVYVAQIPVQIRSASGPWWFGDRRFRGDAPRVQPPPLASIFLPSHSAASARSAAPQPAAPPVVHARGGCRTAVHRSIKGEAR